MYTTNRIDREKVEQVLIKHKRTLPELLQMKEQGKLTDQHFVYTLEDVVLLMYIAAIGHWANCQFQKNAKSEHSTRRGTTLAKKYIKMAFVKGKK